MSRARLIETTLLVLLGVLLAAATINDVVRQTHTNQRLIADLRTWRVYTRHDFRDLSIEQTLYGEAGERAQREVVCGNTLAGPPKTKTQLCLAIAGPVRAGRRSVQGGWYLPAHTDEDLRRYRYGCFGQTTAGFCPAKRTQATGYERAPAGG